MVTEDMEQRFSGLVPRDDFSKIDNAPAPWDTEPDLVIGTYRGFAYAIVRHPVYGCLNGYIAIPQSHPWYNKPYDDIPAELISEDTGDFLWSVHGGLTYADDTLSSARIFTVTIPGPPVWWIGFDTCHSGDYHPKGMAFCRELAQYRNLGYVFEQILNLTRRASQEGPGPDIQPDVHMSTWS